MKKHELLKNLENTLEENKRENQEIINSITREITNEIKQSLNEKLNGVPKGIMRYILSWQIMAIAWTTITVASLCAWAWIGWQVNSKSENLARLKVAEANYRELEPFINLDRIAISKSEDGKTVYITTQSKNAKAYKNDHYTGIISLED